MGSGLDSLQASKCGENREPPASFGIRKAQAGRKCRCRCGVARRERLKTAVNPALPALEPGERRLPSDGPVLRLQRLHRFWAKTGDIQLDDVGHDAAEARPESCQKGCPAMSWIDQDQSDDDRADADPMREGFGEVQNLLQIAGKLVLMEPF